MLWKIITFAVIVILAGLHPSNAKVVMLKCDIGTECRINSTYKNVYYCFRSGEKDSINAEITTNSPMMQWWASEDVYYTLNRRSWQLKIYDVGEDSEAKRFSVMSSKGNCHVSADSADTGHNLVTRVYVDGGSHSNDDAQDVHIVHNDGTDVVAPKEKDQPASTDAALADDQRTVGWLANYWVCPQSYPCPTALVIYRDGHIIRKIDASNGIIWNWSFFGNGARVGFSEGVTHGTSVPQDYRLYDVSTGGLIQKIDAANAQSPKWVKALVKTGER
jgi:hypothetical protein